MIAEIPLTRGFTCVVDSVDFDVLSEFSWVVALRPDGVARGAVTTLYRPKRTIYMHRFIMGATAGTHVDHANGDTLDNRRANLRICSPSQNMMNRRGWGRFGKGVKFCRGRYQARIQAYGRMIHLGSFLTPDEARAVYDVAAREIHGEFARLNAAAADARAAAPVSAQQEVTR